MKAKLSLLAALVALTCAGAAPAQQERGEAAPPEPAPRNEAGRPFISEPPGAENGIWLPVYGSGVPFFVVEDIPFRPWARGLFDTRQEHDLEPHARCKASGAIRQLLTPYGVEILEIEELQRLFIFDIGGPHTWRTVYMDGRSHPQDYEHNSYGHSIGWWQGDTLVIDSVGYNTDFWFERMGLPHTEDVHVIEYYTRRSKDVMDYRFVMEDPTAYDGPVEGQMQLRWREGEELFEYVCQQANYAFDLMVNPEDLEAVGKTSPIIP